MRDTMEPARSKLSRLLEASEPTAGMYVRIYGDHLILGRDVTSEQQSKPERDDRLRLTKIRSRSWGLSVKRHNGRWERTPFSGDLEEMVKTILSFMQHLCAPID
jgi:hypothetical protein